VGATLQVAIESPVPQHHSAALDLRQPHAFNGASCDLKASVMRKVRIVGVGSPFGDDCAGWLAARYLEQHLSQNYPGWLQRCDVLDRPGTVLLDYLKPGDGVILLIDAVAARPGLPAVASYTLEDLANDQVISSHGFGVAETLALGRTLGLLHPEIYLLGVSGGADAWQAGLLAEVDAILAMKPRRDTES